MIMDNNITAMTDDLKASLMDFQHRFGSVGLKERAVAPIAEYLIDDGVLFPPCRIGDDLWWIDEETDTAHCSPGAVAGFVYTEDGFLIRDEDGDDLPLGSTYCFLSKENAEAEIARRTEERDRAAEEARCRSILEAYFARCGGAKDELDRLQLLASAVELAYLVDTPLPKPPKEEAK
jgi:hypothetical protein